MVYLRNTLETKSFYVKQTECDTYFSWYAEASKMFQDSKIASLKNSLQKAIKITDVRGT